MSTKISSTSSNNSSGESSPHDIQYFVNTISNLNLSTILGNKQQLTPSAQGDNEANNGGDNNQKLKSSFAQVAASFVSNKSKFKTIKIFVASNKNEFTNESECLLREVLPELQQYFMQYGYDFSFIDLNLNFDFDPFLDPNLFDCMLKELNECFRISDGCFFMAFLGNKYGITPLPSEISSTQFETIRTLINSQDFEFFKSWYPLDEVTKYYKLKPLINSFPNIYNIQPDNYETRKTEIKTLKDVNEKLLEIFQLLASNELKNSNKSSDSKQTANGSLNSIKPKQLNAQLSERINLSGLEFLTQCALKYSQNECLIINRFIENLDASKKSSEQYIDLLASGKVDKQKEEKQTKFRENPIIQKQLSDDNRHEIKLKWKEKYDEINTNISNKSPIKKQITLQQNEQEQAQQQQQQESNQEAGQTTNIQNDYQSVVITNGVVNTVNRCLERFDPEYKAYLEQFISVVVNKLKMIINKSVKLADPLCNECRFNTQEINLVQEITRHLHKFEALSEFNLSCLDSDEYIERFKRLIQHGAKNDHWPTFIYGQACTGKSNVLTRFASQAISLYPSSHSLIRYFELTSQCSTFEGLLFSLCEQLALSEKQAQPAQDQPQPPPMYQQLKSKDLLQLVEYFYKQCKQLSAKQPVFVFIDGLHDMNTEKSMLPKSAIGNNQIGWMFSSKLPQNVHLIVSIKRQVATLVRTGFENNLMPETGTNLISKRPSTVSPLPTSATSAIVPLFLYYVNDYILNDATNSSENFLFEMPIQIKKLDLNEFGAIVRGHTTFKMDFVLSGPISDEYLKVIIQSLFQNTASSSTDTTGNNSSNYFYLNFLIKDLLMAGKVSSFGSTESFPKDLDSYFKARIDSIEKKFNYKMLTIIFNYISASHNGVTEMELIDLISCNNEFFTEFYSNSDLPTILRFPVAYWIMIKFHLGNFLSKKYVDNKTTYYWSNDIIKKLMKQRYLNKVDQIRQCHKDMANFFLESFIETKPLVDMNRNLQLRDEDGKRYISQQPLVYSDTKYNYRRMSELWFHLMNSGDIQRLKEYSFFNFEHLLAKCHGMSLQILLNDIDTVLRRILDIDLLLMSSLLRKSMNVLMQDPLRLASEILARLRPLEDEYGEHVTSLVSQTLVWCELHDAPVLVPYTSWLETPESLLITKIEHPEGIFKLAVTSFNQHVFFSNAKNEICMYHIPSKKMVRKFNGHSDLITFLIISHNNRYLISGSSDKLIKVWNLGTGEIENTFNNHKSAILCAVLTNSDEFLITGTYDRLINVIRVENGDVVHSIEKHFDSVTALAISQDDSILISASLDKSIKRWSFSDMELVDTISTIYSAITCMTITNDNTFIIIGCENHSVHVKSLITGSDVHELIGHHSSAITSLATSADCERVYVGCSDSKLYLYDIRTKELVAVLVEQEAAINDLKLSADCSFLFSSSGNFLYVLNLKKKKFQASQPKSVTPDASKLIKAFAMAKDGDLAIAGDNQGQVSLWNLIRGELIETIIDTNPGVLENENKQQQQQNIGVCQVALFNSHLFSVIAFTDSTVSVYDNELGDVVTVFTEHQSQVKYLHILEESRKVFTSDGANSCKIWVAHSGQLLETITVACTLIGLSPDIKYVVSGPGENIAKIWTLSDAKVIRTIDHPSRITTMTFTLDSIYVITGGEDCSCKIWELATGKLIQVLIDHDGAITSIAVPMNNSMVISGAKDKLVLVWNFKDGSVMHRLTAHTDIIVKVAITQDSSTVISGSRDGLICVWSSHHGNLLSSVLLQHILADLLISWDGSHIMARLDDSELMPVIGLTRKWPKELQITRTMSTSSLRSFEQANKDLVKRLNKFQMILPIKPKPLMVTKRSANLSTYFNEDAKLNESSKSYRKLSEPNNDNSISTTQNSFSRGNAAGDKLKPKRKTKKTSEHNSGGAGGSQNNEEKQRKTKICCLL